MIRAICTAIAVVAFFVDIAFDNYYTRGGFFFAFMISTFSYMFISLFIASAENGGLDLEQREGEVCNGFSDEWISNALFGTVELCEQGSRYMIIVEMLIILIPTFIISVYFSKILYAYWKVLEPE